MENSYNHPYSKIIQNRLLNNLSEIFTLHKRQFILLILNHINKTVEDNLNANPFHQQTSSLKLLPLYKEA